MLREQYRTVKEVADLLQVNKVTVRRWIKDGELRAIHIGKGWRIGPDDLDAFLVDHATRPAGKDSGDTDATSAETGANETKGREN